LKTIKNYVERRNTIRQRDFMPKFRFKNQKQEIPPHVKAYRPSTYFFGFRIPA